MIRLSVHGRGAESFEELVTQLGPDAFASPTRSTVPLLDYWRVPERRLGDLCDRVGVAPPTDTELHFEYEVPVQAGRGKSSYTDLMILGNDIALAIEAKFTEPRYESVATWLGRAKSPNRADVVDGWIRAIETVTQASIARDAVRELPYQLIHRTASACCVSRRKRCVIYQVFGDSLGRHYADDLEQLVSALRTGDRISFLVLRCAFGLSTKYAQLKARWDADERNLSDAVREALLAGPLMEFHEPRSIRIQPTV